MAEEKSAADRMREGVLYEGLRQIPNFAPVINALRKGECLLDGGIYNDVTRFG